MNKRTIIYANIDAPWSIRARLSILLLRYTFLILVPWHKGAALLVQANVEED